MTKEEITEVVMGIGLAKLVHGITRKYLDLEVAKTLLYTPAQYVKDIITAGYVRAAASDTDDAIATAIMTANGYTFQSKPSGGNLMGTTNLTANAETYRAAAGQKVAAWQFPSTWLSGVVGAIGLGIGAIDFDKGTFLKDHEIGVSALGASMLADGITRGMGVDGTLAAPSGFNVGSAPSMQYLSPEVINNLKILAAENTRLSQELAQIKGSTGRINVTDPHITVHDIVGAGSPLPDRGAEELKRRTSMLGGVNLSRSRTSPEAMKRRTGLNIISA